MAPTRSTPTSSGGVGASTPLSNTRARAVRDASDLSELRGSVGGNGGGAGPGLMEASAALDELAAELDELTDSQQSAFGDLADDMTAVQTFRQATVANLRDVAGDLLDSIAQARTESEGVESREAHAAKVRQLNLEKKRVIEDIVAGDDRVKELEHEASELTRQIEDEHEREVERRREVAKSLPVMGNLLNMYELVTRTKFADKREGWTEGFIAKGGAASVSQNGVAASGSSNAVPVDEVQPFQFDLSTMSRVEAANRLWDMM
jgi:hypothetical protein